MRLDHLPEVAFGDAARVETSVSTMPGLSEFTRIFLGPSSFERATVTASTAALVALYTEASGAGIGPTLELMLTIEPPLPFVSLTASGVVRRRPSTLGVLGFGEEARYVPRLGDVGLDSNGLPVFPDRRTFRGKVFSDGGGRKQDSGMRVSFSIELTLRNAIRCRL